MLFSPTATGARRKTREIYSPRALMSNERKRNEDAPIGDPADSLEPPAKKTRHEKKPIKTEVVAADRKRKKCKHAKESAKLKHDVPRRVTRIYYNKNLHVDSSYSEDVTVEESAWHATARNNNEYTEKPKKRRRQKKRHAKADKDVGEPTKKIQKLVNQVENYADEGVGSLVDLLDDMFVGEKPKKPDETVTSASNAFDLDAVVQWTRQHWSEDCKKVAAMNALRATVVVDEIPLSVCDNLELNLRELFATCGYITEFGVAKFGGTGTPTYHVTVHFETERAAIKALDKDRTYFGDGIIRVRRPGPLEPAVPSYVNLAPQCASAALNRPARNQAAGAIDYDEEESLLFPEARVEGTRGFANYKYEISSESD